MDHSEVVYTKNPPAPKICARWTLHNKEMPEKLVIVILKYHGNYQLRFYRKLPIGYQTIRPRIQLLTSDAELLLQSSNNREKFQEWLKNTVNINETLRERLKYWKYVICDFDLFRAALQE